MANPNPPARNAYRRADEESTKTVSKCPPKCLCGENSVQLLPHGERVCVTCAEEFYREIVRLGADGLRHRKMCDAFNAAMHEGHEADLAHDVSLEAMSSGYPAVLYEQAVRR